MFAELVCGPPGSGKTTYCEGKRQFLSVYDPTRPVTIVNLDPANDGVFPYPCDVDVRELVSLDQVMEAEGLGPNGSYLFCVDVMEARLEDWIMPKLEEAMERRVEETIVNTTQPTAGGGGGRHDRHDRHAPALRAPYLIIDCPGQVEFYINSRLLHRLFRALQKRLQCALCSVHLVDAGIATRDVATYVAATVLALTTMIDHELPHVNVLSKWDTLDLDGDLADADEGRPFLTPSDFVSENFDRLWRRQLRRRRASQRLAERFATDTHLRRASPEGAADAAAFEALDLERDGSRSYKYSKALMGVVEDYGLVGYTPLDIQDQEMMLHLTQEIDNAMGNFF